MSKSGNGSIAQYSSGDLHDFIEGATFLATGGGGPKDVAHDFLNHSGVTSVNVVSAPHVPDEMVLACAAEVFAPSAIEEKRDYQAALKSYEGLVAPGPGKLTGVIPGEVGAINGIVPAIIAGLTNSCLIADTQTDRATSEMDMGLFQNRVPHYYMNMLNDTGETILKKSYPASDKDAMVLEQDVVAAMKAHPELKGIGGFATYPMTGRDLKGYYSQGLLQPNTFDYARRLGAYMGEPDFESKIFNAIQNRLGTSYSPYRMFKGYLANVRQVSENQDYGVADFISSDPQSSLGARVYYSNENMIAFHTLWVLVRTVPTPIEISPMAIGPDAICYLLTSDPFRGGYSFTNAAFTTPYGDPDFFKTHEIEVIGFPEPTLRRPDLIANFKREITATMGAFGETWQGGYIPIEQLQAGRITVDIPRSNDRSGMDFKLTLSGPEPDAVIRYTLDGKEPDMNAKQYTAPLSFGDLAGKPLKARLFYGNDLWGMTTGVHLPDSGSLALGMETDIRRH